MADWLQQLKSYMDDNSNAITDASTALRSGEGIEGGLAAFASGMDKDAIRMAKAAEEQKQADMLARQNSAREALLGEGGSPWMRGMSDVQKEFLASNPKVLDQLNVSQLMKSFNPAEIPERKIITDRTGAKRYANGDYVFDDMVDYVDPSTDKPPTDAQQKAAGFADRIFDALPIIDAFGGEADSGWNNISSNIPIFGNSMVSDKYQQLDQSTRNFINAVLRRESGAAINSEEFTNARKQYIPQYGDSQAVLKQKKQNRKIVLKSMQRSAGSDYKIPVANNTDQAIGVLKVGQSTDLGGGISIKKVSN